MTGSISNTPYLTLLDGSVGRRSNTPHVSPRACPASCLWGSHKAPNRDPQRTLGRLYFDRRLRRLDGSFVLVFCCNQEVILGQTVDLTDSKSTFRSFTSCYVPLMHGLVHAWVGFFYGAITFSKTSPHCRSACECSLKNRMRRPQCDAPTPATTLPSLAWSHCGDLHQPKFERVDSRVKCNSSCLRAISRRLLENVDNEQWPYGLAIDQQWPGSARA